MDVTQVSFDMTYMASVVLVTYVIIKLFDKLNGRKVIKSYVKQIVAVLVNIILGYVFLTFNWIEGKSLIVSGLSSILAYDYFLKPLLEFLNMGYKKNV